MKWNAVSLSGFSNIGMVGDDRWNIDVEKPVAPAIQQVNEAVIEL